MGIKSAIYAGLRISNDINAVGQAIKKESTKPISNRIGRRIFGKITGRIMGKMFR